MTVIQPSMSGLVLGKQILRCSLGCRKFIRDALRLNAKRKNRTVQKEKLGHNTVSTRTWLIPWGSLKLG